jgi:hypothetical protein
VIECEKATGGTYKPGDIIIHPDAWMLCVPGYRNAPPVCKAADDETAAKVSAELAALQPVIDQTRKMLQEKIDGYAASGRYEIDPATGFFRRGPDGVLLGKLSAVIAHTMETADGHKLKPVVQAKSAPAAN